VSRSAIFGTPDHATVTLRHAIELLALPPRGLSNRNRNVPFRETQELSVNSLALRIAIWDYYCRIRVTLFKFPDAVVCGIEPFQGVRERERGGGRARAPRDTHHREIISREMRDEGNRTTSSAPLAWPPGRECSRIFNCTNRSQSTCALGAVAAIPAMLLQRDLLYETARKERFVVSRASSICQIREMTENFHARSINFNCNFSNPAVIGKISYYMSLMFFSVLFVEYKKLKIEN